MPPRGDAYSWTSVRLPVRDLGEIVLEVAEPLLAQLGTMAPLEAERAVVALVVSFWNASVLASKRWDRPRVKEFNELKKRMRGRGSTKEEKAAFDLLVERKRAHWLDPRMVDEWSYEPGGTGPRRLICEVSLPFGVRAEIPPPIEKRIAIGGPQFLDEVLILQLPGQYLGFPYSRHAATVAEDGTVTVNAMMPTALQLFADGRLTRIGGAPVEVAIGGRAPEPMMLKAVRCAGTSNEVAQLIFKRLTNASTEATNGAPIRDGTT
jgi:hypothetical protein